MYRIWCVPKVFHRKRGGACIITNEGTKSRGQGKRGERSEGCRGKKGRGEDDETGVVGILYLALSSTRPARAPTAKSKKLFLTCYSYSTVIVLITAPINGHAAALWKILHLR